MQCAFCIAHLQVLVSWFRGFPDQPQPQHLQFRKNLEHFRVLGWSKNWNQVKPLLFLCRVLSDSKIWSFAPDSELLSKIL